MKQHEYKLVPIKQAEIDCGIIHTCEWLNRFTGVMTAGSCQGYDSEDDTEEPREPFVNFICPSMDRLKMIVNICDLFRTQIGREESVRISVRSSSVLTFDCLLWEMSFETSKALEAFELWIAQKSQVPYWRPEERLASGWKESG